MGKCVYAMLAFVDDAGNEEYVVSEPVYVPGPVKYLTLVDASDQSDVAGAADVTASCSSTDGALITLDRGNRILHSAGR